MVQTRTGASHYEVQNTRQSDRLDYCRPNPAVGRAQEPRNHGEHAPPLVIRPNRLAIRYTALAPYISAPAHRWPLSTSSRIPGSSTARCLKCAVVRLRGALTLTVTGNSKYFRRSTEFEGGSRFTSPCSNPQKAMSSCRGADLSGQEWQ